MVVAGRCVALHFGEERSGRFGAPCRAGRSSARAHLGVARGPVTTRFFERGLHYDGFESWPVATPSARAVDVSICVALNALRVPGRLRTGAVSSGSGSAHPGLFGVALGAASTHSARAEREGRAAARGRPSWHPLRGPGLAIRADATCRAELGRGIRPASGRFGWWYAADATRNAWLRALLAFLATQEVHADGPRTSLSGDHRTRAMRRRRKRRFTPMGGSAAGRGRGARFVRGRRSSQCDGFACTPRFGRFFWRSDAGDSVERVDPSGLAGVFDGAASGAPALSGSCSIPVVVATRLRRNSTNGMRGNRCAPGARVSCVAGSVIRGARSAAVTSAGRPRPRPAESGKRSTSRRRWRWPCSLTSRRQWRATVGGVGVSNR